MLIHPQTLGKIEKIENRYRPLRFKTVLSLEARIWDTKEHRREEPKGVAWKAFPRGRSWGGEGLTRWFKGDFTVPAALAGKRLFLRARTGAVETLVFVDGEMKGVFDGKPFNTPDVNHFAVCAVPKARRGARHHIALEAYAGASHPGTQPDNSATPVTVSSCRYDGIDLLVEDGELSRFLFDLAALRQVMETLDEHSVRRHDLARAMEAVFIAVPAMPTEVPEKVWREGIRTAARQLAPHLKVGDRSKAVPHFGLMGHSHLDTAWLWTVEETTRKCARTFSSVLNLMEQYPEFRFLQSAPYHADVVRREYPALFTRIQAQARKGRWEPNGAMWVEPDGNVPSGESFARQLLYGQLATRAFFGYTGDTLWLPDVFGYSAALPQLLQSAGVKYFCTTKMAWGEVKFPYDTFHWEGIDGSRVLSHLHRIHFSPDPKTLTQQWQTVQHKEVQGGMIAPFGFGDGGGGPHADMIEMARRSMTVDERFTAAYTTVTSFMEHLAKEAKRLPVWAGELYLSAHRGTLTSIAETKRLNRRGEFALRDAEFFATWAALKGAKYPAAELEAHWKSLLLNQFHDILPGSSIAAVNDRAARDLSAVVKGADALAVGAMGRLVEKRGGPSITFFNTLGWDRAGVLSLQDLPKGLVPSAKRQQSWIDLDGETRSLIEGLKLPAMGAASFPLEKSGPSSANSPFTVTRGAIHTPELILKLDPKGRIVSCVLRESGRELVRPGGVLHAFRMAEDVPAAWDNWDVNEDLRLKEAEDHRLLSRKVISRGPLALVIRSRYRLGQSSTAAQDMVLHAHTPRIDFETRIDWREKHRFLKAVFEVEVHGDQARYEIQFGHLERTRHQNLKEDRMKFEAPVAKWFDVSENRFGIAVLNDGKYGAHAGRERLTLSLLKSGTHPDARGDAGVHRVTYSLLPHGAFSSEIIHAAYELNTPIRSAAGTLPAGEGAWVVKVDAPNVIIETVKWAESGKAFIVRLYEAERQRARFRLSFGVPVKSVTEVDLLEEHPRPLALTRGNVSDTLRPFQVKTYRCEI